jgi:hypothetical protein
MAIDRTTLLRGPGAITFDGATLHSEGDIEVTIQHETFEVATSGFGVIDRRKANTMVEVTVTPKEWDDLTKLFPYATLQIGQSIYGATDKPLVIAPREGASSGLTIANAAITSLPSITLSAEKAILGSMTFTGLLANSGDPSDMDDYVATSAVGALTGFDLGKIPNALYSAAWGSAITGIYSEAGFVIDFDLSTEDVRVDGYGIIDKRLTGLGATVKCIPVAQTLSELLGGLGDVGVGAAPAKNNLVITGTGAGAPIVTIANTLVRQSAPRYGASIARQGEIEFVAVRTQTTGLLNALWTFGAVS